MRGISAQRFRVLVSGPASGTPQRLKKNREITSSSSALHGTRQRRLPNEELQVSLPMSMNA